MLDRTVIKSSFAWNAVESYVSQLLQFCISIVMARLLMPEDYGIIGMITIFLCLANAFISAGFPSALVRKKECTEADLSTVFYINIGIGVVMYTILFGIAPFIADFYHMSVLKPVTRAVGLSFVIYSFAGVSETLLTKSLNFKAKAIITLSTQIVTGVLAIWWAYNGAGVWALVYQSLASALLRSILIILLARWRPLLIFSIASFKELFGFGSKILASNLITQIYQNIYSVVIGRAFNATELGYFTRADGYSKLVPISFAGLIQRTLYPILAKIQDNTDELRDVNSKMIRVSSFFVIPLSLILAGTAYPVISIMITDKWINTAPLLQILCITVLPEHLYCINNDFITVRGRSDYLMREQYITKILGIVLLFGSMPFGLYVVAVSKGIGAFVTYLFSAIYLHRIIGVGISRQLAEITPIIIISCIIGVADAIAFRFLDYTILNLAVVLVLSAGVYLLCARCFFANTLKTILNMRK